MTCMNGRVTVMSVVMYKIPSTNSGDYIRSPMFSRRSSWKREGIQFNDEEKKNGSISYLEMTTVGPNMATLKMITYLPPSICRVGPDIFLTKRALTRMSDPCCGCSR